MVSTRIATGLNENAGIVTSGTLINEHHCLDNEINADKSQTSVDSSRFSALETGDRQKDLASSGLVDGLDKNENYSRNVSFCDSLHDGRTPGEYANDEDVLFDDDVVEEDQYDGSDVYWQRSLDANCSQDNNEELKSERGVDLRSYRGAKKANVENNQ